MVVNPVECLSSASYPGAPTALTREGKRHLVAQVIARSHTPQGFAFRVRTTDDQVFDLFYDEAAQTWQITPLEEEA